ncbi:MAG: hypothetical protein JWP89_4539 [Schlesneria sp.]|nr:hypothetical protein [Schlesneria sp.]
MAMMPYLLTGLGIGMNAGPSVPGEAMFANVANFRPTCTELLSSNDLTKETKCQRF